MPAEEGLGFALNPGGDAQAAETDRDMAGNVQDRKVPDPHGEFVLPGGAEAFQNIPYEGIPETVDQPPPPEVVAKPTIPGPQYAPQGSSGGIPLFLTTTTEESQPALVPQQPPRQPATGDAATPFQPLAAAADAVEAAPSSDPPLDPPVDPNPPTIDASDFGEALTFDGGLSDGNFVGDQGAGDTNASPVVASVDFAANFTITPPGPGATRTIVYALGLDGAYTEGSPSGLTSGGVPIRLYEIGGVITGSTSLTEGGVNAGNTTFTIEISSSSGVLSLTQSQPIDHSQTDIYDGAYIEDLSLLANGQVELLVSVTDDYGSGIVTSATASIDLGGNIQFGDDGPAITDISEVTSEAVLLTDDGGLSGGNAGGDTSDSTDYSGVFETAAGTDYGADSGSNASLSSSGFDLELQVVEGTQATGSINAPLSTDQSLTSGNEAVYLYTLDGNTIVGSTLTALEWSLLSEAQQADPSVGEYVFRVQTSDAGVVTLTQYAEIDHLPTDGASSDYADQTWTLDDGQIYLRGTVTVTDNDTDTAADTNGYLDLGGNLRITDDGPVETTAVTPDLDGLSLLTGDGGLTGGNDKALAASDSDDGIDISALFIAAVTADYGADGAGTQTASNFQFASTTPGLTAGATTGVDSGLALSDGSTVYAYLSADGLTLTGTDSSSSGGTTVFTITIDGSTGAVSQTQSAALEHSDPEDGSGLSNVDGFYSDDRVDLSAGLNLSITADVTTTDADGDYVTNDTVTSGDIASSFVFGDDGPVETTAVTPDLDGLSLLTGDGGLTGGNDKALAASDSDDGIDISALFIAAVTADYGADGAGTQTASNFQFASTTPGLTAGATTGVDSGLALSDGSTVYAYLSADGLTLTGTDSSSSGGTTVFTITIDGSTGAVSQTQSAALEHSDPEDGSGLSNVDGFYSDDRVDLSAGLNLSITADVTTTDADGDYVTNDTVTSGDIASSFVFGDDGPVETTAVTPDLDGLSLLTGDGGLTGGNDKALAASDSDDGIDISALFIAAVTADYGADGAGTQTASNFQFASTTPGLTAGATTGVDSGLALSDGSTVYAYLSADGLTLTGTDSSSSGGTTVFTITIDGSTGAVSQTQSAALEHSDPEDGSGLSNVDGFYSDDRVDLSAGLNLSITADVTTTDADGDYVTNDTVTSGDIASSFVFGDDGPVETTAVTPDLDGLSLLTGDGGLTGGNDKALAASDSDDGIDISALFIAAVTADYGADGAGTQTASNFQFASTTPGLTAGATTGVDSGLALSDGSTVYAYLSADGLTLTGTDSSSSGGTTVFTITIDGSTGAVSQTQSAALEHSDPEDGSGLSNVDGFYSDDRVDLSAGLNLSITADVTTTDADGDYVTNDTVTSGDIASSFVFGDDGPVETTAVTPDLDGLSLLTGDGGLTGGNDKALAASDSDDGIDISALFIAAVTADYGADGAGTQTASNFQFASTTPGLTAGATTGVDSGLALSDGSTVYAYLSADGLTLTGTDSSSSGGTTVFTITIDGSTGAVSQTQSAALEHSDPEDGSGLSNVDGFYSDDRVDLSAGLNLSITADVTTTDADGDYVTNDTVTSGDIASSFVFGDDGPVETTAVTPDLDGLSLLTGDGGLTGGNDKALAASDSDDGIDISALFIAAVTADYGADGAGTQTASNFQFASTTPGLTAGATTGVDSGLALSDGSTVYAYLSADGLTLTGTDSSSSGGTTVFTITIDGSTGAVSQTQSAALEHSDPEDGSGLSNVDGFYSDDRVDLSAGLNLSITADVTTTDADGDYVTNDTVTSGDIASSFVFGDDGPVETTAVTPDLDGLSLLTGDGGLTGGNDKALAASDSDDGIDISALFIAAVTADYGADGAGTQTASNFQFASTTPGLTAGATTGVDSGLALSDGSTVYAYLSADGLTLTGTDSSSSGGTTVFTITIDGSTGAVSQTQSAALEHSDPEDGSGLSNVDGFYSDDRVDLSAGLNLSITADVTTTDADGDYVTNDTVTSGDIASSFVFGDDGPVETTAVTPDLDGLSLLTGDGGLTGGNDKALAASDSDDGIDISALFIAAVTADYGADGAGTQTASNFQFASTTPGLTAGATTGVDSGLALSDGSTVYAYLSADGLTLTGTDSSSSGGTTVFTITIDGSTGAVSQTQSAALEHSDPEDGSGLSNVDGFYSDDRVDLSAGLNLSITADVTTTDADGDYVTNDTVTSGDIASSFVFGDDGPVETTAVTPDLDGLSLLTGDGGLTGGNDKALAASDSDDGIDISALFIAAVTADYGADGAGTQTASNFQFASTTPGLTAGATTGVDSGLALSDGSTVYAYLSADGLTLTGTDSSSSGGTTVFTITIDGSTGAVSQTQSAALEHSDPEDGSGLSNVDGFYSDDRVDLSAGLNLSITADVTTTDADGDYVTNDTVTSGDIASSFVFGDDGPLLNPVSTVTLTAPYNSSSTPVLWAYQFYDWSYGADLVSPLLSAASIDVSLTSGTSTDFSIANIVYGADYDFSFDVFYDNGIAPSLVSSVYLDADGTDLLFVYSLPTEKVLVDVDSLTPAAGGPQPAYEYIDINSAGLDLVVTGSGDVNNSSNGWAVGGNQNINPGESIVFSYFSDYGLVGPPTPEFVTDFEFQTSKYTGGISSTRLAVEVFYSDGSVGFWIVSDLLEGATIAIGDTGLVAVNPDPGDPPPVIVTGAGHTVTDYSLLYREVDIQYIGQKGGLNLTNAAFNSYEQNADGLSFAVNIVPIDSDGDTATETLTVVLEGTDGTSDELDVSVGPVVLDLNRDSTVEYLHLESSAEPYSLGIFQLAAWLAPADGLLVYDYNADGLIAEPKEFVFTMWGDDPAVLSDMQALAAYFDSTGDGFLDASDDAWEYFGVWQDLNIDGIQQEGEFYGLDHWGIESIALEYDADSASYAAADGDVQVYGQMTVTYDNGTTGLAEDVAFAVASVDRAEILVEPIAVDSSAVSSVEDLVNSYLESMHSAGDLDGNGDLSQSELASGLDLAVNDYLTANALSADEYGAIEQEVFNLLAEQINDLDPDSPVDIQIDDQGNADAADLIAALDLTFDELMPPDLPEAFDPVPVANEYG